MKNSITFLSTPLLTVILFVVVVFFALRFGPVTPRPEQTAYSPARQTEFQQAERKPKGRGKLSSSGVRKTDTPASASIARATSKGTQSSVTPGKPNNRGLSQTLPS